MKNMSLAGDESAGDLFFSCRCPRSPDQATHAPAFLQVPARATSIQGCRPLRPHPAAWHRRPRLRRPRCDPAAEDPLLAVITPPSRQSWCSGLSPYGDGGDHHPPHADFPLFSHLAVPGYHPPVSPTFRSGEMRASPVLFKRTPTARRGRGL